MPEELTLFNYQNDCQPCWRWFKEAKCWNCKNFVGGMKSELCCHCGTCAECETPSPEGWFSGCEYDNRKGKKYLDWERKSKDDIRRSY